MKDLYKEIILGLLISILAIFVIDGIIRDIHYNRTSERLTPILVEMWQDVATK